MKNIIRILCLIAFVLIEYNLVAQNSKLIKGTVFEINKDGNEIGIPGVNVYWAGTTIGVSTNLDGLFSLELPEGKLFNLVVSFVGFKNDTLTIDPTASVHLKILLSTNQELDEVLIIERVPGAHISRMNLILTQKITTAELQKAACCNLAESFETNASVDVSFSDAVSGAKQIKMLGLAGIYSQLQTENIPNLRGLASIYGLGYIPGTWMESIQISKGTASVKNGYESITGQINTEFIKPDVSDPFHFNMYMNNFGKIEGNLYSGTKLNDKLSTMVFLHAENYNKSRDKNDDGFFDHPKIKQVNFFNRWKYDSKNIHVQFGFKVLKEKREGGQLSFIKDEFRNSVNGYGIGIETDRYEIFTKTAYLFNKPGTNIGYINSFIHHKQESFFGLNDYVAREDNYYGNLMFQTYIGNSNHQLTSGVSYVLDNYNEQLNDSTFVRKESVPGTFVEYTYINPEKLSLILGIRADFHNLFGAFITPRIHLKYNLSDKTIFRTSVGRGYRSANVIAENTYLLASSRMIKIQEEPEMEKAWNYGVNLTQYLKFFGKELSVNLEYYRTNFDNQIVIDREQNTSAVYVYNLKGKSYSNSFQIEGNYELFDGFDITAAARYNDVKVTINNSLVRKPLVSDFKGLINLSYTTNLKKWQFDFTAQFTGKSRIPNTSGNPIEYQLDEYSPSYTLLNTQITKYFRRWEIYVGVENLTNFKQQNPILAADNPFGEYFDSSLIWGPITGRKIYAGIRFRIKKL
jgi:outer membrane receptor for ferrienterochelin and colicin